MIMCTNCGFQNETDDAFCGSCGAFLEWAGEQAEPAAVPVAAGASAAGGTGAAVAPGAPPAPAAPDDAEIRRRSEAEAEVTVEEVADEVTVEVVEDAEEAETSRPADAVIDTSPPPPTAPAPAATATEPVVQTRTGPVTATPDAAPDEPPAAPAAQPPTARRPEAVKPAAPRVRPVPTKAPPPREVRPGDLLCAECGEGNDPNRRFCRSCGNSLVEAETAVEPPPPPPVPWWKKPFIRRPQVAAAGERPMRRGGIQNAQRGLRQARGKYYKVAAVLAILGIGVFGFGPKVREKLNEASRSARRALAEPQPVAAFDAVASSERPGHPAKAAIDEGNNTYWSEGAPGDGTGESLTVSLGEPDIDYVIFLSGAQGRRDEFAAHPRPRQVEVVFFDAAGGEVAKKTVNLKSEPTDQTSEVKARGVARAQIRIGSCYPSIDPAAEGGTDCSITEVQFKRKA